MLYLALLHLWLLFSARQDLWTWASLLLSEPQNDAKSTIIYYLLRKWGEYIATSNNKEFYNNEFHDLGNEMKIFLLVMADGCAQIESLRSRSIE